MLVSSVLTTDRPVTVQRLKIQSCSSARASWRCRLRWSLGAALAGAVGAGRGARRRRRRRAARRPCPATVCGQPVRRPRALPPAGSRAGRLSDRAVLRGAGQRLGRRAADLSLLHPAQERSQPSQGIWVPVRRERPSRSIRDDFKRLWATNFLDNLSIETSSDYTFPNGVSARSSSTTWRSASASRSSTTQGRKKVEHAEDRREAARTTNAEIRLDTFIDAGARPQGRRHRPRHDEGEGLPVRRGHATRSRRWPAGRSWCT